MAVVQFPTGTQAKETLVCVLCDTPIHPSAAMVGLLTADNQQTFACDYHFLWGGQFIVGWAKFLISEQPKIRGTVYRMEFEEDDKWTLH